MTDGRRSTAGEEDLSTRLFQNSFSGCLKLTFSRNMSQKRKAESPFASYLADDEASDIKQM